MVISYKKNGSTITFSGHNNYKKKENCAVDKIKNTFADLFWISDKKIQNGYSRRKHQNEEENNKV